MGELIDHNALIGPFPFRRLPDPTPQRLLADMDRLGITGAWVGHVPSVWYRDAAAGNDELFAALEGSRPRLAPVPAVNPSWPGWEARDRAGEGRALSGRAHLSVAVRLPRLGAAHGPPWPPRAPRPASTSS